MTTLNFAELQNLKQIEALKNAKIKTSFNQNLLNKRQDQIRREARNLRKFASLKSGSVADYCLALAEQLESKI